MHSFELLTRKFMSTYRMGKTYEKLSEKYWQYDKIFVRYTQSIGAGAVTATAAEIAAQEALEKDKFNSDAN